EAQNRKALLPQEGIPALVVFAFGVLRPVSLDNQASLETDEINNVGGDHELPAELENWHPPVPQHRPEAAFGGCRARSHLSCSLMQGLALFPHPPTRLRRAGPSLSRKG